MPDLMLYVICWPGKVCEYLPGNYTFCVGKNEVFESIHIRSTCLPYFCLPVPRPGQPSHLDCNISITEKSKLSTQKTWTQSKNKTNPITILFFGWDERTIKLLQLFVGSRLHNPLSNYLVNLFLPFAGHWSWWRTERKRILLSNWWNSTNSIRRLGKHTEGTVFSGKVFGSNSSKLWPAKGYERLFRLYGKCMA